MKRSKSVRALAALVLCSAFAPGLHAQTVGPDYPVPPSLEYGGLYFDVELGGLFPDSKTFPDLVPSGTPSDVTAAYDAAKGSPGFDLANFVNGNFSGPTPAGPTVNPAASGQGLLDYVSSLWPVLQQTTTSVPAYSTLLPLPYPYIVPGGRVPGGVLLGLLLHHAPGWRWTGGTDIATDMLKNFAYEIDKYGHIPNGNRSYYLSRSQPPFFSLMIDLIAQHNGNDAYTTYLPELQAEYDYWMQGEANVLPGHAARNVVRLLDGTVLNRYWDERAARRVTSLIRRTLKTALADVSLRLRRSLAESACGGRVGLGFQLTLARRRQKLEHDTDTCLCCHPISTVCSHTLRTTLSKSYSLIQGNSDLAARNTHSERKNRIDAIQSFDVGPAEDGVFADYLWREGKTTQNVTAATLYPLFLNVCIRRTSDRSVANAD